MKSYDIDPTQQNWAENGHYDYDEVFEMAKAVIREAHPNAHITREAEVHDGNMIISGPDADDLEASLDLPSLTWISDEDEDND